jgi:septal ring factor EnvC (AmiA/AmiB activator)
MKHVINIFFILFFCVIANGQTAKSKLQKEQLKSEKKINQTKLMIDKIKNSSANSLSEISLLENQINTREQLVTIYDNQIKVADNQVVGKKEDIELLKLRIEQLKEQYKKMIIYAYKNRNKSGKLMFLLTSSSFNEAKRRNTYLKKVTMLQSKQLILIQTNKKLYHSEILDLKMSRLENEKIISQKKQEQESIGLDKALKENSYNSLKAEEQKLFLQLKEEQRKKEGLRQRINAVIQNEIAAAQEKERKKLAKEKKESKKVVVPVEKKKEPNIINKETIPISSEGAVAGKKFEANKGRLPSPVSNGTITEKYGKNPHPTLAGVYTNNNGIDITCSGNSKARAVFEGVVSAVINVSGAGKVIIIKHGGYRTVYSNLQEASVKLGDNITSKQEIGTIMLNEGNKSVLHFEIHMIVGSGTQSLNPYLWISR